MTDIVERLFASDEASVLTNEAAREIERLRKALEFYADVSKYSAPFTDGMGDCGEVARVALERSSSVDKCGACVTSVED